MAAAACSKADETFLVPLQPIHFLHLGISMSSRQLRQIESQLSRESRRIN